MEIIRTNLLTKHFGSTVATDNISILVKQGEIYGFIGLNGAGKTTLIRMLLGMIKPDIGSVKLFGRPLNLQFKLWNDVGYLVETPYSYPNLSIVDNLKVYYNLRQLKNPGLIDDIISKLKLTKYKDKKAKVLSLGNQQRLGLAKALMHRPKLLILDEPINGLDPEGIVEVRGLLRELADNGSTIFLSSHILGEISKVANRIGIIHEGQLIKELTTAEMTSQLIKKVVVNTNDNKSAVKHLTDYNHHAILNSNNEIEISDDPAIARPENISKLLVEKNLPPKQVYLYTEDLEMYFLRTIRSN
ncbi:MAG: ATP-binding cassette domain-containing protein [Bacteroidota bacterium]|nr:ATP-binding cassette domain-containing protein [Bacteroidota bacterium]